VTDSTKGREKKGKGSKRSMVGPKDIFNYRKEAYHWKRDCPKKAKKDCVVVVV